jgi:hypothetical protein
MGKQRSTGLAGLVNRCPGPFTHSRFHTLVRGLSCVRRRLLCSHEATAK